MIVLVRTAQAAPGKLGDFLAFAKEIAAFIKSKHGTEVIVLHQDGGPIGSVRWVFSMRIMPLTKTRGES